MTLHSPFRIRIHRRQNNISMVNCDTYLLKSLEIKELRTILQKNFEHNFSIDARQTQAMTVVPSPRSKRKYLHEQWNVALSNKT